MLTHEYKVRVRYGDTDQMGYLYYGHYAKYYEIGRAEMMRWVGMTYRELEESGVFMPVVSMRARYVRPARYDELLTLKTTLRKIPDTHNVTFYTDIYNEAGKIVNGGEVRLVFMSDKTQSPCLPPDELIAKLKPLFENART